MKNWVISSLLIVLCPPTMAQLDRLIDYGHRIDRDAFVEALYVSLSEVASWSDHVIDEDHINLDTSESNYIIITATATGTVILSWALGAMATAAFGSTMLGTFVGSGMAAGFGSVGAVSYGLEEPGEISAVAAVSSGMASVGVLGASGGAGVGAMVKLVGFVSGSSGAVGSHHFHRLIGRCEEVGGSLCDAFYMPVNNHYRIELNYRVAKVGSSSDYVPGTCIVFFTVDQLGQSLNLDYEIDDCSPHGGDHDGSIFPETRRGTIRVGGGVDRLDRFMGQEFVVAKGSYGEVLGGSPRSSSADYDRFFGGQNDFGFLKEFIWPVPSSREISAVFGQPRRGGAHEGIDIAAIAGSDIVAAADGVVTFSGYNNDGYGNLVIISHPQSNLTTLYAHNSTNYVRVGEKVERGEVIATVGSTGRSRGNHLHFEVLRDNVSLDPFDFMDISTLD